MEPKQVGERKMKITLKSKYALTLLLSASSYYCLQIPYFFFDSRFSEDYEDLLAAVQFLFNFIFVTSLIVGYIIDYVGVIHLLIPLNIILVLGQAVFSVGWWRTNHWILSFGFFLITLAAQSLTIAKWVFIANTFIPKKLSLPNKTKDTSGYSALVLYSNIVDMIFVLIPIVTASSKFSIIFGCVFAVIGLIAAIFTVRAEFAKANKEIYQVGGFVTNSFSGMGVSLLSEANNDLTTEEELETHTHLNNKISNLNESDSPSVLRVWRSLSVYVVAGLIGYCLYEFASRTVANKIHETYTNILGFFSNIQAGIIPSTVLVFSYLLLARMRLGKRKIEYLMIASGGLLLLSSLINPINTEATDIISISLFIGSLLINPYLFSVYLPHIAQYDLRSFGFVCGLYLWPKNLLNLVMLIPSASYYQENDVATKARGNHAAYWSVMVGFPVIALLLGLAFLYGEKYRSKRPVRQVQESQSQISQSAQSQGENPSARANQRSAHQIGDEEEKKIE